jgi:hypothetical protein
VTNREIRVRRNADNYRLALVSVDLDDPARDEVRYLHPPVRPRARVGVGEPGPVQVERHVGAWRPAVVSGPSIGTPSHSAHGIVRSAVVAATGALVR